MSGVVIHDMNPSIAEQLDWEHEDEYSGILSISILP